MTPWRSRASPVRSGAGKVRIALRYIQSSIALTHAQRSSSPSVRCTLLCQTKGMAGCLIHLVYRSADDSDDVGAPPNGACLLPRTPSSQDNKGAPCANADKDDPLGPVAVCGRRARGRHRTGRHATTEQDAFWCVFMIPTTHRAGYSHVEFIYRCRVLAGPELDDARGGECRLSLSCVVSSLR